MQFLCPKCGTAHDIEYDGSGGSFECSSCGNEVIVPPSDDIANSNQEDLDFNRVICKSCGKRINTEQLHAGQEFNCPFCKTVNKVGQNLKSEINLNTVQTGASISASGAGYPEPPPEQNAIPQIIGRCKVEGLIGSGAMGYVFKATHSTLNIPVAIKVLRSEFSNIKNYSDRFIREAQTAAKLNHQNIIRVFDCGYENSMLYMIMEYVDGGSLADALEKRGCAFEPDKVIEIGVAVAQALVEAERFAIIHRDIKPANIMMTSDGIIKLADLGLAKQVRPIGGNKQHTLTMDIVAMGTPVYMPPEQAMDARKCDIRADIYALGITLYHLLCGRPPFLAYDPNELFKQHQTEFAQAPSQVNPASSPELDALILKCIMKSPEDRYQSPKQLLDDLNLIKHGKKPKFATPATKIIDEVIPIAPEKKVITGAPEPKTKIKKEKKSLHTALVVGLIFAIFAIVAVNLWLMLNPRNKNQQPLSRNVQNNNYDTPDTLQPPQQITEPQKKIIKPSTLLPQSFEYSDNENTFPLPQPDLKDNFSPTQETLTEEKREIKVINEAKKTEFEERKEKKDLTAFQIEKITKILSELSNIYDLSEQIRSFGFRHKEGWQIKEKLTLMAFERNWESRKKKISEIAESEFLPPELAKKFKALSLAFAYADEYESDEFTASATNQVREFDKDSNFATILYAPQNTTTQSPEISGNYNINKDFFSIARKQDISLSIPLIYAPMSRESRPISITLNTSELKENSGLSVKFNACMEFDKIENIPQHIKIYFVIMKKNQTAKAKILIRRQEQTLLSESKDIPKNLMREKNTIQTSIMPGKLLLKINNSTIFEYETDGKVLNSHEFLYPEIIGYEEPVNIYNVLISGQILPIWLAAKIATPNTAIEENGFAKWFLKQKE